MADDDIQVLHFRIIDKEVEDAIEQMPDWAYNQIIDGMVQDLMNMPVQGEA